MDAPEVVEVISGIFALGCFVGAQVAAIYGAFQLAGFLLADSFLLAKFVKARQS